MEENIIKDYGWCQLIVQDDRYIIRFDSGGVASKVTEYYVSKEELEKSLIDQLHAEKVIIEIEKKKSKE